MSTWKRLTAGQKWVIALIGLTSLLAVRNFGRAVMALQYAMSLPNLSTRVPLTYFAAMGGIWSVVFVLCTVGLSLFRDWGRWLTLAAITLYQAHLWVNRFLFNVSDYARQVYSGNVVLTAILLSIFWGLLSLPTVRAAFGRGEAA